MGCIIFTAQCCELYYPVQPAVLGCIILYSPQYWAVLSCTAHSIGLFYPIQITALGCIILYSPQYWAVLSYTDHSSGLYYPVQTTIIDNVAQAIQTAIDQAHAPNDPNDPNDQEIICIAGSLYLVGEAKAALNESNVGT